jgi:hypothetical protein
LVLALILRFVNYFSIAHGWGNGVTNPEVHGFLHDTGQDRFLFLIPLIVLAPLCEEAVNRGFIYKAFRGSYSMMVSMAFLLAWNAFTHWGQYHHSCNAAIVLSMLTIVLCYLREKSATSTTTGQFAVDIAPRGAEIVFKPFCISTPGKINHENSLLFALRRVSDHGELIANRWPCPGKPHSIGKLAAIRHGGVVRL